MSTTVNGVQSDALSQWLSQMREMQDALAKLNLPESTDVVPYGQDIDVGESPSPGTSSDDDIWDLISGNEEASNEDSSSNEGIVDHYETLEGKIMSRTYDRIWLAQVCAQVAAGKSGLEASDLQGHVSALLASDILNEDLQLILADTLGYDELDLVTEFLSHRKDIIASPSVTNQHKALDGLSHLQTREQREEALRRQDYEHKNKQLAASVEREGAEYPHVYKNHQAGNTLSASGHRYALPAGSKREDHKDFEEYSIPAIPVGTLGKGHKLVEIATLDGLCKRTFKGYTALNRMQSLLFQVAYHTSENMLISAPTGAGKTDAAMLTILNAIAKNITPEPTEDNEITDFIVDTSAFKIIYVAPMKALAAEITEKFSKRLSWLGIQVRELTGDMHLTKAEIVKTQIIVTTPEKWDVSNTVFSILLLILTACRS